MNEEQLFIKLSLILNKTVEQVKQTPYVRLLVDMVEKHEDLNQE
jgi:hypothetical protein